MTTTWNLTLPSFPYTLGFISDPTSDLQEYVIKLPLSAGTYELSVLPDLMVMTSAEGTPTADDVNAFIPEAVISSVYVTRAIDYWDSDGSLYNYDVVVANLYSTEDTIAEAIVESQGYTANYGEFSFYTADVTIGQTETHTYASGSREVYTDDYYLHIQGNNVSYALGASGLNTELSGRFLITLGAPTGQRSTAWGSDWLNIQYILDDYNAPDVTLPTVYDLADVTSIPGAAQWTSTSDGTTMVSPSYEYAADSGYWLLAGDPGTYDASQAYLISGEGRTSFLDAVGQTCAWGAIMAQFAKLPSIVQSLYSAVGTATTLYNLESNYLTDLLGFLDRAPSAILNGGALDLNAEIEARLDKFDADTQQICRDALVDSAASDEASASIVNLFRSIKLIHHQSTEFYTLMSGEDPFVGGSHADTMIGSYNDDVFYGGDNNDAAFGMQGIDTLAGGAGNDALDGGAGLDTAIFSGGRSNYAIVRTESGFTITDAIGTDGSDSLASIERLQFSDKHIALDLASTDNAGQTLLFIGVLAPDLLSSSETVGEILSYFDAGLNMQQLNQLAVDIGLVSSLAGGSSNADMARMAYENVMGAAATPDTVDFLVSFMDGRSASFSQSEFLTVVANLDVNQAHVDLVGLAQTGVEYVP